METQDRKHTRLLRSTCADSEQRIAEERQEWRRNGKVLSVGRERRREMGLRRMGWREVAMK